VAWSQTSGEQDVVYGQSISSSGSLQQVAGGVRLCPGQKPFVVKGLNGDVIVVGGNTKSQSPKPNIYAQCVDALGVPRWKADGELISQGYPRVAVPDESGGAMVIWLSPNPDSHSNGLFAQRIDQAGVLQWGAGGARPTTRICGYPAATSDNDRGMVVAWEYYQGEDLIALPAQADIYAQRVRGSGQLGNADIPPVVTSMEPSHGIVGATVTIRGSHFSPVAKENVVIVGSSRAEIASATDSLIRTYVPIGELHAAPSVTFGRLTGYGCTPFVSTTPSTHLITEALFDTSFCLGTGGPPWSLDMGDLNGDGKQDIVIAISDRNVVSVRLNTGMMAAGQPLSFAPALELSSNSNPTGVSVADLDGDGLPDILVACEGDNTVCMFQNNSVGDTLRFAPAISFGVGSKPKGAMVADLDGDGRPEVITPNGGGQSISILPNHCDLREIRSTSFGAAIDQPVGSGPLSALVRDFDGDLRPDIAVACDGLQSVVVLRNTSTPGTFTFAGSGTFSCGGAPGRMTSGDVDGDGLPDIAVPLTNGSSVAVLRNNSRTGTISFDPVVQFVTGGGAWCAAFADMNGDARIDLTVANYNAGTISILRNTSVPGPLTAGSFAQAATLTTGGNPLHLRMSDFNGDGLADVVAADRTGEKVRVVMGLDVAPEPLQITSFAPSTVQAGDVVTIDGSGFSTSPFGNSVRIGQMSAEILTSEPTRITVRVNERSSTGTIRVTTLGRTAFSRRPLRVTFPTAAMLDSTAFQESCTVDPWTAVRYGFNDCDGDGRPELLVVPYASPTSSPFISPVALFKNISGNRTVSFENVSFPEFSVTTMAISGTVFLWNDVDGDGRDDLVFFSRRHISAFMRNTSTPGAPSFSKHIWMQHGYSGNQFFDDFNGDGKADVFHSWRESGTGPPEFTFFKNSSTQGLLSTESFVPTQPAGLGIVPEMVADLDADGLPDLLALRSDSDSNLVVCRNKCTAGLLSFGSPIVLPIRYGTPSFKDMDCDDLPDILIDGSPGSIYRNTSQGGTISFAPPTQMAIGGSATTGDFTGDGLPDVMILADTLAHAYVNTSSNGAISFGPPAVFRCEGTIGGIADLNGDGKDDIVVHRQRDSSVVIFESTFGVSSAPFAQEWRIPGKHPQLDALIDIDGDEVVDILTRTRQTGVSNSYRGDFVILRNRIGDRYTLQASSDSLGTISPAGDVHVLHGGSQVFVLTPNPGCVLDSVLVDGVRVDSTTSYTFTKVISDHTISARFATATDVEERTHPREFSLQQNFPNPFNPTTTIGYQVPITSQVRLVVYDLLGREVCVLLDEVKPPGTYTAKWDAVNVATGLYFCRMKAESFSEIKKLLLVR